MGFFSSYDSTILMHKVSHMKYLFTTMQWFSCVKLNHNIYTLIKSYIFLIDISYNWTNGLNKEYVINYNW